MGELTDGKYYLWHIPSGSLPLLSARAFGENEIIKDPFAGWVERRAGADPSVPFFGSTPKIIELQKISKGVEFSDSIGLSSFGWIGNRYSVLGEEASRTTENWWRRMQWWVKKVAIEKIPRWDFIDGPKPEIWAFSSAYKRI